MVEKRERQRDVSTTARLVSAGVLEDGTALTLRPEGVNEEVRGRITAWANEDPRRGLARWQNVQGAPLIWDADHNPYSLSGMAELAVEQAAGVSRSIRGGDWWVTDDGRDLVEIAQELASPRQRLYFEFLARLAEQLRDHPDLVLRGNPSQNSWLEMKSPLPHSYLAASFVRDGRIKSELTIDSGDADRNQKQLAKLRASRVAIETRCGAPLEWVDPSPEHRYAQVAAFNVGDITEEERHAEFADWFIRTGEKLWRAVDGVRT